MRFSELATRIDAVETSRFGEFELRWRRRIGEQGIEPAELMTLMNSVNPLFIPRNHRVEQAIQKAVEGDLGIFEDLNAVLARPFVEQPEYAQYAEAPERNERVSRTLCGT